MILVVIIYKLYTSLHNYIYVLIRTARLYLINIIYTGYIITYEEVIYFEIKRKKEHYPVYTVKSYNHYFKLNKI